MGCSKGTKEQRRIDARFFNMDAKDEARIWACLGRPVDSRDPHMVRELCSRSTLPREYGPPSIPKGFSTTSPMRIMALLGDRLGDSLHTNRGKIEISQVFMIISYLQEASLWRYNVRLFRLQGSLTIAAVRLLSGAWRSHSIFNSPR